MNLSEGLILVVAATQPNGGWRFRWTTPADMLATGRVALVHTIYEGEHGRQQAGPHCAIRFVAQAPKRTVGYPRFQRAAGRLPI